MKRIDQTAGVLRHQGMQNTNEAQRFLESLHRYDLAKLLSHCHHEVRKVRSNGGFRGSSASYTFVVVAPVPISDALQGLAQHDKQRIGEALTTGNPDSWEVFEASD
ncbi:hypothetical protein [Devosia sp. A369]